ncbi:hypothetical protein GAY29_12655 [Azospirillum brasilense]|uniref:hypothetical protein n=1 Tax=Azospirillum brasilense TaxID=192 RepID=UPI00190C36AD|nr:hypothetical protein [Azospirillum brasilense]MBK3733952.1 hypothetical protein [Azospirillum brasilense]
MTDDHSPVDNGLVIEHANRFEAIAAEGFEGHPYRDALAHQAQHVTAHPDLAPRVAHALRMMIGFIEDSDPSKRFGPKVAILREAVELLEG